MRITKGYGRRFQGSGLLSACLLLVGCGGVVPPEVDLDYVTCSRCKGELVALVCQDCKGEGYRQVGVKQSLERCPLCLGTGMDKDRAAAIGGASGSPLLDRCVPCKGLGFRALSKPIFKLCDRCQGKGGGTVLMRCPLCRGAGKVTRGTELPNSSPPG